MKYIIITLIFMFGSCFGFWLSYQARPDEVAERQIKAQQKYIAELKNRTVTERMIEIQRELGCKILDGKVGPETTPLLNAKVDEEKPEYCTEQAIKSMARMSKGDKE